MPRIVLLAGTAALLALAPVAFAQGGAKAPPTRSSASLECSQKADAQGLHGKARKHFRSKCMRSLAKVPGSKTGPAHGFR